MGAMFISMSYFRTFCQMLRRNLKKKMVNNIDLTQYTSEDKYLAQNSIK